MRLDLVISVTPPIQTYYLERRANYKENTINFPAEEGDIGCARKVRNELEKRAPFLKSSNEGQDFPLDIRHARFQRRVWEVLGTVRIGAVITYSALARRVGQPDAIAAVANACAHCQFAIAISCQRAVRTNRRPFRAFSLSTLDAQERRL